MKLLSQQACFRKIRTPRLFNMGLICCTETSVINYHSTQGKIPKQSRSAVDSLYSAKVRNKRYLKNVRE